MVDEAKSPGALLADSMYEAPVETVVEPVVDTPVDGTQTIVEDKPEEVVDEAVVDSGESEDEVEISSVEELAAHFELDPEWLETLNLTKKINGKDVQISIADAIDTKMKVEAADDVLSQAKVKAKTILEESTKEREALAGNVAVFGNLIKTLEAEFDQGMSAEESKKLQKEDPAEWAMKQEVMRQKKDALNAIKAQAANAYQASTAQLLEQQQTQREQGLPKEREILLSKVPEWSDDEAAKKEQTELAQYLTDDGFSSEQIKAASYNGAILALAVKAMRYDRSKTKSEAAKKKVVKIPKILKPGAKPDQSKASPESGDRVSLLYG